MNHSPSISIITAVKNGEKTIRDCIRSVAVQKIADLEHLIIDGQSTDGTITAVESMSSKSVRIISEPPKGIYAAMNSGIIAARGNIIGILNSDDYYADDRVLTWVRSILSDEEVEACYGDLVYVRSANEDSVVRYWRAGPLHVDKFLSGWMPPHPTFFVKRRVYERLGLFNLALGTAADYELMLRFIFKNRIRCEYIPQVLVKMRTGGASGASLKSRWRANRNDRKAWEVNGLKSKWWTVVLKPLRKISQLFFRPKK
ncbi:MAG TPA: glycosyl transferase [Bdellovibrionales bacterium]|nr:MAG: glycosyl transferase [Bdellovibrionales bacterium GWB1_52_6]OFZ05214.1 MAG: glycosyl transferase [Bdellovibrionales bacterium GWA1_52_35]HAR43979.1 glycosyl transferase [Bdellovibrionales bacterium]HCM38655.1 glycosyl transferase [Bdellovibrionales bacterium]